MSAPIEKAFRFGGCPVRSIMGVQALATGSFVPDQVVRNEDLSALGCDSDWIVQRTGIRERRHAPPTMATADMATEAARRCLDRAGISPTEVDLIVVGTFTPDWLVPGAANLVQDRLGISSAAMDVQSACSGFMYALITGMQFVKTGCSRMALVIGADCNSRIADPADVKSYPLFGDAAGAVLLTEGSAEQGFVSYTLGSDGSGAELLYRPMGGSGVAMTAEGIEQRMQYLRMDGRPVFRWAIRLLEETIREVVRHAELTLSDIDLVILHQANIRIIDAAVAQLGIDPGKVFNNLERYGNTSAASIPLALDEAIGRGLIHAGDRLLLSGYGAGLSWGTGILQW